MAFNRAPDEFQPTEPEPLSDDEMALRCGAVNSSGQTCFLPVPRAGERCFKHRPNAYTRTIPLRRARGVVGDYSRKLR